MDVRAATDSDIPEIILLLRQSLGESLMPKSEAYWSWKHKANPFGPSPVLVSTDAGKIVGVRAFMQWRWVDGNKQYRALRAVDTATHPGYQGKGIFKKLSLSLVEICKKEGYDFIFNSPNKQSMPGYIKMGWSEVGRMPLSISLRRPLRMARRLITSELGQMQAVVDNSLDYYLKHPNLGDLLAFHRQQNGKLATDLSTEYLDWRYRKVPVARYIAVGQERGNVLVALIIGRIKETKLGREFRITDSLLGDQVDFKQLQSKLNETKRIMHVDYTTQSSSVDPKNRQLTGRLRVNLPIGPIVTVRPLQTNNAIKNFIDWSPTLGDLELF